MKRKDLKIGTKIVIGLSIILFFVVGLAGVSLYEIFLIWQNTTHIYDHSLQVRRAFGEVKSGIFRIQVDTRNIILSANREDAFLHVQDIHIAEADVFKYFDILSERYTGPTADYEKAHNSFKEWKPLRDETVRLALSGERAKALSRIEPGGAEGKHLNMMLSDIETINVFSLKKGDILYQAALLQYNNLFLQMIIMSAIILLLSLAIILVLTRSVRLPLQELTRAADDFRSGKLDERSTYRSGNEFGILSDSFNSLAKTIQNEIMNRKDSADLADIMLKEEELGSFCREVILMLLQKTGSQVGAFYFLNDKMTDFVLVESIGLKADAKKTFSAVSFEGELGAALKTRTIQHLKEIPADTVFGYSTVSAELMPAEIITIPILSGSQVAAIISLSSVHKYTDAALSLVENISSMLVARLDGVLAFEKQKKMAQQLEIQNKELEEKSNELAIQASELGEQNIEVEMQKEQLGEANRLKSAFLSNMSHELRTPLNSVIALSGVLSRKLKGKISKEEYSYIDIIERSGNQLLELINDVLDLSRIEAGKEEVNLSRFSVFELISVVLSTIEHQAHEKKLKLKNHTDGDLPYITSDFTKCRQILQNIVANAVKFTMSGFVEVSALKLDDSINIIIKDTGIGIAEGNLPNIFDEFRMVDEGTSRKYGGTGLGLAIAKKYAHLLNGEINVKSELGKGSVFTISLPLKFSGFIKESSGGGLVKYLLPSQVSRKQTFLTADKNILIVEDSEAAIIQLSEILGEQGYRLSVARNGKEALNKIQEYLPDAIILDLMMPEVDGFEVLKTIRDNGRTARVPVLILTAKHITHEELSFLKGNNIYELIQKGNINKQDLLDIVKNMLCSETGKKNPCRTLPRDKKASILVIEDNTDNMETIKALLQENYNIIEAVDGESGIILAKSNVPDIILLDISLPQMDGFAVYDEIRKEKHLKDIPIMALTARVMKGDREEILNHGFTGYLSKPVDEKLLHKTIQEALNEN